MKIVYIAHPIAGDVRGNISRIERIIKHVLQQRQGVFPIAPYLDCCRYLNDSNEADRLNGFTFNYEFFFRKAFDELWICGGISSGVQKEMGWAQARGIPLEIKDFTFLDDKEAA